MFDAKNGRKLILKIIEETLVIKVSEFSFSKLKVYEKSYTKPNLFFAPP
jgi:hypothetical protein